MHHVSNGDPLFFNKIAIRSCAQENHTLHLTTSKTFIIECTVLSI